MEEHSDAHCSTWGEPVKETSIGKCPWVLHTVKQKSKGNPEYVCVGSIFTPHTYVKQCGGRLEIYLEMKENM